MKEHDWAAQAVTSMADTGYQNMMDVLAMLLDLNPRRSAEIAAWEQRLHDLMDRCYTGIAKTRVIRDADSHAAMMALMRDNMVLSGEVAGDLQALLDEVQAATTHWH